MNHKYERQGKKDKQVDLLFIFDLRHEPLLGCIPMVSGADGLKGRPVTFKIDRQGECWRALDQLGFAIIVNILEENPVLRMTRKQCFERLDWLGFWLSIR